MPDVPLLLVDGYALPDTVRCGKPFDPSVSLDTSEKSQASVA